MAVQAAQRRVPVRGRRMKGTVSSPASPLALLLLALFDFQESKLVMPPAPIPQIPHGLLLFFLSILNEMLLSNLPPSPAGTAGSAYLTFCP